MTYILTTSITMLSRMRTSSTRDAVRNVCADHSDPPKLLEKKEAHEVRTKCLQLDWYSQQLYQVLVLNCKR